MKFNCEKFRNDRYNILTQEELAEKTGITINLIKNVENGRKKVEQGDELFENICNTIGLNSSDYWTRDTKVLACFNNKGGVGKTSLVCNIATVMVSEYNKRVLIVDCDAQKNTSQNFNMESLEEADLKNVYRAFINQDSIENHIINTGYENIDMVVGHGKLDSIDKEYGEASFKEEMFKNILADIREKGEYDFIIIDTAPVLSIFNSIIIRATDGVIIPFEPETMALAGVGNVVDFINRLKDQEKLKRSGEINNFRILGIVVNKYNAKTKISKAFTDIVNELYPKLVFKNVIRDSVVIKNAQSEKLPIAINYSKTPPYDDLTKLVGEIINEAEKN